MKKFMVVMIVICTLYLLTVNLLADEQQDNFQAPESEDFSSLTWSEAFDKLHAKFSREYGFTDWKKIDWSVLYNQFKPRINQAWESNDFEAYYLTLREYVHSIPDGHVHMNSLSEIDNRYIGGGFGFSIVKLTNGKIVVMWIDESSEAYAQGMRAGAELVEWNGRPVQAVLNEVSTIFSNNSATDEDCINQKVRYLTRAPIGTKLSLSFKNLDEEIIKATLVAYDDQGESLKKTYPATTVSDGLRELILGVENPQNLPESMIEKKILNGDIGYLKIWGLFDADLMGTGEIPSTLGLFKTAIEEFNQKQVKGLIVDIRNNVGGLDSMVADMLASFYTEKTLYEYQSCYNVLSGSWEIRPDETREVNPADPGLYIEPDEPFFGGPIVAIINSKCISSGEGLAMGIRNLPDGETLGFYGTNGSFGLVGSGAQMPGGIEIRWPFGQSLDKNRQVQIDSRDGIGGVAPSIRIPMTLENALRIAQGEDVELEQAIEFIKNL
ncbi:MAG: PDZ domain-containing protein [Candidatus Atribacteria bacterium]|nr:PDZ domain-containing protein [Candidatus Atribacteria bacterium]